MPINFFSDEEIKKHLSALGIMNGSEVIIHSSLLSFGKTKYGAKSFLDSIREIIGPKGSMFAPAFIFDNSTPFSIQVIPSMNGALSKAMIACNDVYRSNNYMHSYIGLGKAAPLLNSVRSDASFGSNTFFDLATKRNMIWVMLGVDINSGCTLLHHSEYLAKVPYRKEIIISRKILDKNRTVQSIDYSYFARVDEKFKQDFNRAKDYLLTAGLLRAVRAPYGASLSGSSSLIHNLIFDKLQKDPYFLVNLNE